MKCNDTSRSQGTLALNKNLTPKHHTRRPPGRITADHEDGSKCTENLTQREKQLQQQTRGTTQITREPDKMGQKPNAARAMPRGQCRASSVRGQCARAVRAGSAARAVPRGQCRAVCFSKLRGYCAWCAWSSLCDY